VSGGTTGNSYGIYNTGGSTLIVNGNVTGGTTTLAHGIELVSGTLTVNGSVASSGTSTGAGIDVSGAATVTVNGDITAGQSAAGLVGVASGTIVIAGNLYGNANGTPAIYAPVWRRGTMPAVKQYRIALDGVSTYGTFYTADNSLGQAAVTDVRYGVVYAGGALTGKCRIPPPAAVALGTPVDATTGTAAVTPQQIWDKLAAELTVAGSIGERLQNAATIASVGEQLAAAIP